MNTVVTIFYRKQAINIKIQNSEQTELTEITLKLIEKYIDSPEAIKSAMADINYNNLICKTLSNGLMLINTMGANYGKTIIDVLIQNDSLYKFLIKSIYY